jgi:hypothetical protein
MAYTLIVHLNNEDAVVGEVEELPEPSAQFLIVTSPRLRDGRDVSYLLPETNTVIYPWTRIHSIEILPTESDEQIVTFIRE